MKQLKSTSSDLRDLLAKNMTVRNVAEPLASFDDAANAQEVKRFMDARHFDVVGIRREGAVVGYAHVEDLVDGHLADHIREIEASVFVDDTEPLAHTFLMMRAHEWLFVQSIGRVNGIVTRGDMRKIPVRMWLFGLISLIEMQLLRLIRETYSESAWKGYLKSGRCKKAEDEFAGLKGKNADIELADCLQFCDKRDIVVKSDLLLRAIGFGPAHDLEELLKRLEALRNNLAHAQDVIGDKLPDLISLAEQAKQLLGCCENAMPAN
jgi:hypothetical protein